ncbi:MAG: hypothetical protein ACKO96_07445, partial [Flammeovirgaceae bacterium]
TPKPQNPCLNNIKLINIIMGNEISPYFTEKWTCKEFKLGILAMILFELPTLFGLNVYLAYYVK